MRTLLLLALQILPTEGSRFALEVDKTGLWRGRRHVFVFERYRGELDYDAARPENARVRFTVDTNSLVLTDQWLSAKDQRKVREYALKDMLAAEQYPEIVFESSRVTAKGGRQFAVEGTLTIRGIPKPVVVDLTTDGPWFEGSAIVKMTDYGLKPPSAALGAIGTRDQMKVSFRVAAGR